MLHSNGDEIDVPMSSTKTAKSSKVVLSIHYRLGLSIRVLAGLVSLLVVISGCESREMPEEYRDMPVPGALIRSPEAISAGANLFFLHCSPCHGERADGKGAIRRSLSSKPVDFTKREWREEVSPQWVYYMVREGRRHTAMANFDKRLDEEACWNLTAYVLSVAKE